MLQSEKDKIVEMLDKMESEIMIIRGILFGQPVVDNKPKQIECVGFTNITERILKEAGINDMEQLSVLSRAELKAIGITRQSMIEVIDTLDTLGYAK